MKENKGLYFWIFVSLFLSAFSCYYVYDAYKQHSVIKEYDSYSTLIIGILSLMFAFSAFSIYSVFNANVDRIKSDLETEINKYKETILTLTEKIRIIEDLNMQNYYLSNLLNDYTSDSIKIAAVFYLHNYFNGLTLIEKQLMYVRIGEIIEEYSRLDKNENPYLKKYIKNLIRDMNKCKN